MILFLILALIATFSGLHCAQSHNPKGKKSATFRGAVYEHAIQDVILDQSDLSRAGVWKALSVNVQPLTEAARNAKNQGADIVVFPEYAITGFAWSNRSHVRAVLEDIKDVGVNPCTSMPEQTIQNWLSCLAKELKMYITANVGDLKFCNRAKDSKCPQDGAYQYNTNVVYDRNGKLVHRYHKINLYGLESHFMDYGPLGQQNLVFKTEFGRMSSMVCFDIVMNEPAVPLTEANLVDTILFPTAWMSKFPHFLSIQYHSSWSVRHNVNLLAAETHRRKYRMTGSGLYTTTGAVRYTFDMDTENPKLVVADLPIKPQRQVFTVPEIETPEWAEPEFKNKYYNFVKMSTPSGTVRVCKGNICCKAEYSYTEGKSENEFYALGASYLIPYHKNGSLEICVVVKCRNGQQSGCGKFVSDTATTFTSISLSGSFSSDQVHPSASLNGLKMASGSQLDTSTVGTIKTKVNHLPIVTMVLLGRNYDAKKPNN